MVVTRVLLLRHGQSTWNADGRWQGQADPPLSPMGRAQAFAAVAALGTVDAVISSDLLRAVETADVVASNLGVGPVLVDDRWRERNAGEWTGLTRRQIESGWPGFLDDHRRPLGWEPTASVAERAFDALAHLATAFAGAEVVVVTHSGVIRSVEESLGVDQSPSPNLAGRWLDARVAGDGQSVTLGERVRLIDAAAVAATMVE